MNRSQKAEANPIWIYGHLVVAVMFFIATGRHPYAYYQFLRIAVFGMCAWGVWINGKDRDVWVVAPYAAIGILFNPLAPFYLSKTTWKPIDIICGVFFAGVFLSQHRRPSL